MYKTFLARGQYKKKSWAEFGSEAVGLQTPALDKNIISKPIFP